MIEEREPEPIGPVLARLLDKLTPCESAASPRAEPSSAPAAGGGGVCDAGDCEAAGTLPRRRERACGEQATGDGTDPPAITTWLHWASDQVHRQAHEHGYAVRRILHASTGSLYIRLQSAQGVRVAVRLSDHRGRRHGGNDRLFCIRRQAPGRLSGLSHFLKSHADSFREAIV